MSVLLQTIQAALEEAERNTSENPWTLTRQSSDVACALSTVKNDLESNNLISIHRNAHSHAVWWAKLEYLGLELLHVLRTPDLRTQLEQRLISHTKTLTVREVSDLANEVILENDGKD